MFYERECSSHRGQQRAEVVRVVVPPAPPQGGGLEVQVLSLCPGRALWALSSGVSSPNPCACFYRTHASYEQGYMYVTRIHVCNTLLSHAHWHFTVHVCFNVQGHRAVTFYSDWDWVCPFWRKPLPPPQSGHGAARTLNPSFMQLNYLPVNADILQYSNCTPCLDPMAKTMLGGLTGLPRWFGPTVHQKLASSQVSLPHSQGLCWANRRRGLCGRKSSRGRFSLYCEHPSKGNRIADSIQPCSEHCLSSGWP